MKKIYTILIIAFCVNLSVFAQNSIVNDNSAWATLISVVCPQCPVLTEYVYFDGDSIVTEHYYKKVLSCNDELHENISYQGLIREYEKKVYFIPANSETEYMLYDFSLEEGMTFVYQSMFMGPLLSEVQTCDMVEINGLLKKRWQISFEDELIVDTWIEDVGSLKGILHPCIELPGVSHTLLCSYQNDELIYKNPAYDECYYNNTSTQTIEDNSYNIFPNPTADILNISDFNSSILRIEIFNNLGAQIYSQAHTNPIDLSSFSKGLYLLKVYNANNQVSVFKIVKN